MDLMEFVIALNMLAIKKIIKEMNVTFEVRKKLIRETENELEEHLNELNELDDMLERHYKVQEAFQDGAAYSNVVFDWLEESIASARKTIKTDRGFMRAIEMTMDSDLNDLQEQLEYQVRLQNLLFVMKLLT